MPLEAKTRAKVPTAVADVSDVILTGPPPLPATAPAVKVCVALAVLVARVRSTRTRC